MKTVRLEDLSDKCIICNTKFSKGMNVIKCGICGIFTCSDWCDSEHGNMELGL